MNGLREALRQPLPYIVFLGALVFAVDFWLRRPPNTNTDPALIEPEVTARLKQSLSRPPTDQEVRRGIQEWVNTELLFREALALELDENDSVIREHLAQKLRHIVRERVFLSEPTESELRARLKADPKRYSGPRTFDLTHAFVNKALSSTPHPARVEEALARLEKGAKPGTVGDHFPRGPRFTHMTSRQLERILDTELSSALDAKRVGQWQALQSPRGTHLVRLDAIHDGKPSFEALRPALIADVQEQKKQAAVRAYLQDLRKKYPLDASLSH